MEVKTLTLMITEELRELIPTRPLEITNVHSCKKLGQKGAIRADIQTESLNGFLSFILVDGYVYTKKICLSARKI